MKLTMKCAAADCNKEFTRKSEKIPKSKRCYCSLDCMRRTIMAETDKCMPYVKENIGKLTYDQMAKELGITSDSLKLRVLNWRRRGHEVGVKVDNKKKKRVTRLDYFDWEELNNTIF